MPLWEVVLLALVLNKDVLACFPNPESAAIIRANGVTAHCFGGVSVLLAAITLVLRLSRGRFFQPSAICLYVVLGWLVLFSSFWHYHWQSSDCGMGAADGARFAVYLAGALVFWQVAALLRDRWLRHKARTVMS